VLIVDDEIAARLVTREVLLNSGFVVEEAEDGAAALRMLEELEPDIVIADVMMPVMDGFTLCEEIRRLSLPPCAGLPFPVLKPRFVFAPNKVLGYFVGKPFLYLSCPLPGNLEAVADLLQCHRLVAHHAVFEDI
jgi:hypothetical protein